MRKCGITFPCKDIRPKKHHRHRRHICRAAVGDSVLQRTAFSTEGSFRTHFSLLCDTEEKNDGNCWRRRGKEPQSGSKQDFGSKCEDIWEEEKWPLFERTRKAASHVMDTRPVSKKILLSQRAIFSYRYFNYYRVCETHAKKKRIHFMRCMSEQHCAFKGLLRFLLLHSTSPASKNTFVSCAKACFPAL